MASSDRTPLLPALVLSALVVTVLFVADGAGLFRLWDLRTWDLFHRVRGERVADERIALVTVDDATLRAYGRWPLARDAYALLLQALEEAGAQAIGLDLLFLDPNEQERPLDLLLATITGKYTNIVHSITAFQSESRSAVDPVPDRGRALASTRPQAIEAESVAAAVVEEIALPFSELAEAARALAHVSVMIDEDGKVRRVPLLLRHDGELYPALALRLVGIALGWPDPLEVRPSPAEAGFTVTARDATISYPLGRDGGTAFDFAGDRNAFSRTYSMVEVLQQYRDGQSAELVEKFGGRIVLVGVTAMGEAAADIGSTPFAVATPLLYFHANLVDALLHDRIVWDASQFFVFTAAGLLAVALAIGLVMLPLGWAIVSAAAVFGVIVAADFLLLTRAGVQVPPTATLLVAPGALAVITAYRVLFLERSLREWEPLLRTLRSFRGKLSRAGASGEKREIGNYRLEELLGRGGMGEVWRASHRLLDRQAAVKLIRREALGMADAAQSLAVLQRFEREVQATASLQSEHTVEIYDFGVDEESTFYYVMELLDGVSLDELVRRFGPIPAERAVHVLLQVCDSFDDAHGNGLIHRDIKPANILLCRKGSRVDHAKVVDFGLVKRREDISRDSGLTQHGTVAGTPAFMAPEQVLARTHIDGRADLYSLGCVAYWLLTGMLVFERESPMEMLIAHAREEPVCPSRLSELLIPDDLERIILSCLEKKPELRPPSASALAAQLEQCECHGAWTADRAKVWWKLHLRKAAAERAPATADQRTVLESADQEGSPSALSRRREPE